MIYYISDLHLGHENIIRHCSRPFSGADEMDAVLIKNWNDKVQRDDTAALCHYPMMSWPGIGNGGYMIYGHIHNSTDADYWPLIASRDQMLNAGVDINGFAPVSLEEMIENNRRFKEENRTCDRDCRQRY